MITLHNMNTADYQHLRYQALVGAEGKWLDPYIDTEGWYTTGLGFLLKYQGTSSHVRSSVYSTLGFNLTGLPADQQLIEDGYMKELSDIFNQNYKGRPSFDPVVTYHTDLDSAYHPIRE